MNNKQYSLRAQKEILYHLDVAKDILDPANEALTKLCALDERSRRLIFLDSEFSKHNREKIEAYFGAREMAITIVVMEVSENAKSIHTVLDVIHQFDRFGLLRRSEPVLVFGGGVLLDIVGFAASIYRRGVPLIRIPTTLLALIDAALGVKNGVSFGNSKNRIGNYFAPQSVILDKTFLQTLPHRHLRNGMAEILKIAIIKDSRLLELLEKAGRETMKSRFQIGQVSDEIIDRAIVAMLEELEPNLYETDLTRLADFGHSFSPYIEKNSETDILHGEAVSIDMALCVMISFRKKLLGKVATLRLLEIFKMLELPISWSEGSPEVLFHSLEDIVRHRDGLLRMPLPTETGDVVFVNDVTLDEVRFAHQSLQMYTQADNVELT